MRPRGSTHTLQLVAAAIALACLLALVACASKPAKPVPAHAQIIVSAT